MATKKAGGSSRNGRDRNVWSTCAPHSGGQDRLGGVDARSSATTVHGQRCFLSPRRSTREPRQERAPGGPRHQRSRRRRPTKVKTRQVFNLIKTP